MVSKKRKAVKISLFDIFNSAFMIMLAFVMLYPLWYVLIASFSSSEAVTAGQVYFWPKDVNLRSYTYMFEDSSVLLSYGNTILYAVLGTLFSMVLTTTGAYSLSKKRLRGRGILTIISTLPMWFSAGLMPSYLNLDNLGLIDTRLGVIVAVAVSSFYVILMKNYFESIPDALEESAKIDGADDYVVFYKIFLPLSVPALMTITLYYFVARWNAYFWPMLILRDETKVPLQVLLRKIVVEMNTTAIDGGNLDFTTVSRETILYSTIVVAVVPMLVIYPFVQKFFVKGIMVGSVKG